MYYVCPVTDKSKSWTESDSKCKHVSLTHYIRRHYLPRQLSDIIHKCDVSVDLGRLPPQLCKLVPLDMRASAHKQMAGAIKNFWINNEDEILDSNKNLVFDLPELSSLFNTQCQMHTMAILAVGHSLWSGGFGFVCKMTFPQIGVEYAVKYFYSLPAPRCSVHGPRYEIPTAFAACHAEPKDNCMIYMASLDPQARFMMSRWAGETEDGRIRPNKNEIFITNQEECTRRNFRNGQRIDFGDTRITLYGALPYRVRKLYRQVENAAKSNDCDAAHQLCHNLKRQHIHYKHYSLWELLLDLAYANGRMDMCDFIRKCAQYHR